MKKYLSLLLVLVMLVGALIPMGAVAASELKGKPQAKTVASAETLFDYKSNDESYTLHFKEVNNVVSLINISIETETTQVNIVVPETVTATSGTYKPTHIDIPSGNLNRDDKNKIVSFTADHITSIVNNIKNDTFSEAATLETVSMKELSGSLPRNMFANCTSLTMVNIPKLTQIGEYSFYGCTGLVSLPTMSATTYIGSYAFGNCGFTSLTIPSGIYWGSNAFTSCASLTSVTWPAGVSAGQHMFYNCENLNAVEWPTTGEVTIPSYMFSRCAFTTLSLPANVTTGVGAFYGCTKLTTVTIAKATKSIGDNAFYDCQKLETVTFSENNVGDSGNLTIGSYAFKNTKLNNTFTLPTRLEKIGISVFNDSEITEIKIPKHVSDMGGTFSENTKIKKIIIASDNTKFKNGTEDSERAVFSRDGTQLVVYPSAYSVEKIYTVPDSVTTIGNYAFDSCSFSTLTMNNTIKKIGDYAFNKYKSTGSLTFLSNITEGIGNYAFYSAKFISIKFQGSVGNIGSSAFYNSSAKTITFGESVGATIGSDAFRSSRATSLEFKSGVTSVGNGAFYGANANSISLPDTVTSLGSDVPQYYDGRYDIWGVFETSKLESFTMPAGVTSIPTDAFANCQNLKKIVIGKDTKKLSINDARAFANSTNFKGFEVAENNETFKSIGSDEVGTLYSKDGKTLVLFPAYNNDLYSEGTSKDGTTTYNKTFSVPEGVTTIKSQAFNFYGDSEYAKFIDQIVLPNSITAVEKKAFSAHAVKEVVALIDDLNSNALRAEAFDYRLYRNWTDYYNNEECDEKCSDKYGDVGDVGDVSKKHFRLYVYENSAIHFNFIAKKNIGKCAIVYSNPKEEAGKGHIMRGTLLNENSQLFKMGLQEEAGIERGYLHLVATRQGDVEAKYESLVDDKGTFLFMNLPAGEYLIEAKVEKSIANNKNPTYKNYFIRPEKISVYAGESEQNIKLKYAPKPNLDVTLKAAGSVKMPTAKVALYKATKKLESVNWTQEAELVATQETKLNADENTYSFDFGSVVDANYYYRAMVVELSNIGESKIEGYPDVIVYEKKDAPKSEWVIRADALKDKSGIQFSYNEEEKLDTDVLAVPNLSLSTGLVYKGQNVTPSLTNLRCINNIQKDAYQMIQLKVTLPKGLSFSENKVVSEYTTAEQRVNKNDMSAKVDSLPIFVDEAMCEDMSVISVQYKLASDAQWKVLRRLSLTFSDMNLKGPDIMAGSGFATFYGNAPRGAEVQLYKKAADGTLTKIDGASAVAVGKLYKMRVKGESVGVNGMATVVAQTVLNGIKINSNELGLTVQKELPPMPDKISMSGVASFKAKDPNVASLDLFSVFTHEDMKGYDFAINVQFKDYDGADSGSKDGIKILNVVYQFANGEVTATKSLSNGREVYSAVMNDWDVTNGGARSLIAKVYTTEGTHDYGIAEGTVLIDPSGIVKDSETGQVVSGAEATCYEFVNGKWKIWNAEDYGQINPMTTDIEGKYGWMVADGVYRVTVNHEDYRDYDTMYDPKFSTDGKSTIIIPPPRTDVDIALTPKVSRPTPTGDPGGIPGPSGMPTPTPKPTKGPTPTPGPTNTLSPKPTNTPPTGSGIPLPTATASAPVYTNSPWNPLPDVPTNIPTETAIPTVSAAPEKIKVTDISASGGKSVIKVNEKLEITSKVSPESADVQEVKWYSANPSILFVTETGIMQGISPGTALLCATAGEFRRYYVITVLMPVTKIDITPKGSRILEGKTYEIKCKVNDNASNKELKYTSSDTKLLQVNQKGQFKALTGAKGKTFTITVTAKDGVGAKATCKVIVG